MDTDTQALLDEYHDTIEAITFAYALALRRLAQRKTPGDEGTARPEMEAPREAPRTGQD